MRPKRELHALGQLIQRGQDEKGWSDHRLLDEAAKRGHDLEREQFERLKYSEGILGITVPQMQVFQDLFGFEPREVSKAATDSWLNTETSLLQEWEDKSWKAGMDLQYLYYKMRNWFQRKR